MYRSFKNFAFVCDDYLDNLHVVSIKSLDKCVFCFLMPKCSMCTTLLGAAPRRYQVSVQLESV